MSAAVVNKIEAILHSTYDTKNYVDFIREVFPNVRIIAPDKFNKEFSNFSSHIEGSIHVGTFQTPDGKKIIIMAVQQKKAGYVENARSTQRSYAKKLIENGNADAALIAFYTEGDPKWRLSLVRLDYEMKIENGRLKTSENLTPAKRYSYLVGQDEPCHTAISRFNRFMIVSSAPSILHWMIWRKHLALKRLQTNSLTCTAKSIMSCVSSWKPSRTSALRPSSITSLLPNLQRN